ncbi:hypothetical protein AB0M11_26305 [Streptomyces sp. NPDC051987]|uniref:hypothetical protein n=1 Tax=Streptomyces sp. NPDC051987 TaxID=3155808 RepID=UPI003444C7B4
MSEPITNLPDAVAAQGALPMPVGTEPRTLNVVEEELTGANLALYEEELENARLRLALKSAQRGRRELRADVQFLEPSRARWRKACIDAEGERDLLKARVAELEAERHSTNEALDDAVRELRAREVERSEDKLTRLLAPVQALRESLEDPHDSPLHHEYRVSHDLPLPETGGAS